MKKIIHLIIISTFLAGCEKSERPVVGSPTLNVVNAVVNATQLKVNYHGRSISWSTYTGSIGNVNYGTNQSLLLFNSNVDYPLEVVIASDTTKFVFNQKVDLETNGIYTLFATGQAPSATEALWVKEENIPYNYTDSAVAVRFINLSPNSPAVNITLASTPTISETSGLIYKQKTEFKKYADLKIVPNGSLTFQVRDAATNSLLTSYTFPALSGTAPYGAVSATLSRFKSVTLVIKGLAGTSSGVNAFSVFPVPHY